MNDTRPSAPKGIYARISDDAEDTGLGVQRQIKDGTAVCDIRGWKGETYVDNDVSAFQKKVVRPEFERLLQDLRSGALSGIVGYNLDRLFRQPRDLERAIDIYDDFPELTFSTVEGDINLATADGRTMARVMVAFANKSSADTGRRTKRKHLELAEAGEPVGRRTFGWKADKRTLDPVEAAHARQVVDEILSGGGLREAVLAWNDAGIRTTNGKLWSHQSLRKYLTNPRLAGDRTYHGEVLLDSEGHPVRGTWTPLLDRDTFDRLQVALDRGRASGARRGARKYHLTGLLRCGVCHGLMFGSKAKEPGRFNYVCSTSDSTTADRHTNTVSGQIVDRIVDAMVFGHLSREGVENSTPPVEWPKAARLSEVVAQIDKLMGAFMAGTLSSETVFPRVETLDKERKLLQGERTAWLAATIGPKIERETFESWEARTPDERRQRADQVLRGVYVRRAATKGKFDKSRLTPVWVNGGDQEGPV